jgi:hypothetical protein
MSIQYREQSSPFDVYNADYTQFYDYHHSFDTAPRTSLLRFTISPGQHVFNNLDYSNLMLKDSRYIPYAQTLFLAYDPRIKYLNGLKHVKQQNDYIDQQQKNKIQIEYKQYY